MRRLSKAIAKGEGDDGLRESLAALRVNAGDEPTPSSADAAKPWLAVEDDLEETIRLDLQREFLAEDISESRSEDGNDSSEDVEVG